MKTVGDFRPFQILESKAHLVPYSISVYRFFGDAFVCKTKLGVIRYQTVFAGENKAFSLLLPGGVLAVISFHSLEDRIVKKFFEAAANPASCIDPRLPLLPSQLPQPLFNRAVRILPSEKECEENPRARSSVLRGASRTDAPWPEQGVQG